MNDPAMNESRKIRVLATCGVFEPGFRGGGPIRSVAALLDTTPECVDATLITRDRDLGSRTPYRGLANQWIIRGRARVFYLNLASPRQWLRLWRDLRRTPFDLLYVNSLWDPHFSILPLVAVFFGLLSARRALVAPRGELDPSALAIKGLKKRAFLVLWIRILRQLDVSWHASTNQEASHIRAVFPWAAVTVSLNPTSLPAEPLPPVLHTGHVRLVFIGRICRKKNLADLLGALQLVNKPTDVDIYGPVEDAHYWAKCRGMMAQLPPNVRVRYCGELPPDHVRRTFAMYDAFAFPTTGENFGHVIAESLSASCPVICSDRTPWTSVLEDGGGVVIRDLTTGRLAAEIERYADLCPAQRAAGRAAAAAAYRSWRSSTDQSHVFDQVRSSQWFVTR